MNEPTMTRAERQAWGTKREAYDAVIIERARASGTLPVIDCTAEKYPVPAHILRELDFLNSPAARDTTWREVSALRTQAKKMRSLADSLERKGKESDALRAKADEYEQQADAIEKNAAPV
jgi:hypothetical protein